MKIILSDIVKVSVSKLKENPLNEKYFPGLDDSAEFDALYDDIESRGILNPLVAKRDGTLLAGHRRLKIARLQGKKSVPVQWCEQDLSPDAELEYLLKDNVLRRHLSPEERKALYKAVCKNFERRVDLENSKHRITARELAEKTGLNPRTVNYDLSRIKHEQRKEKNLKSAVDIANDKAIAQYKRAVAHILNVAMVEKKKTASEFIAVTKTALERLQGIIELQSKQTGL